MCATSAEVGSHTQQQQAEGLGLMRGITHIANVVQPLVRALHHGVDARAILRHDRVLVLEQPQCGVEFLELLASGGSFIHAEVLVAYPRRPAVWTLSIVVRQGRDPLPVVSEVFPVRRQHHVSVRLPTVAHATVDTPWLLYVANAALL